MTKNRSTRTRRAVLTGFLVLACVGLAVSAGAQRPPASNLMPQPASLTLGSDNLSLDARFGVKVEGSSDPRLHRAVERLLERLTKLTGLPIVRSGSVAALAIVCPRGPVRTQRVVEDESYSLRVASSGAVLRAPSVYGALRGLETFAQLVEQTQGGFVVRGATIEDHPRFAWRGLLIDVCRHWMPVEVIERNLDAMAAVKLNVLHWHLSEDQAFRVESRVFPLLQQRGSDGLYYTQDQVREVVRYAADRGIRVVPEFDMPAHTLAWLVGYPSLSAGKGPFNLARTWGVFDPVLDPTSERVYAFLGRFIGEMATLFPDAYFHIGGDEVNGKQWDANAAIVAFRKRHAMASNDDLQAYFNRRVAAILKSHGKIMVGWDEVLHKDLPATAVVQSWRGQKSLADAANAGFRGILSNGYYLDYMWPAARHYAVDPLGKDAASLPDRAKARILGGEACMWAEWVTPETIDSRIWPRMAAIAERFWSPASVTDPDDMYRRLEVLSDRLDATGILHRSNYEPMLERLAANGPTGSVRRLVDLLEPVKDYNRGRRSAFTSLSPLIRIVDAARPESDSAREFRGMVDRLLADPGKAAGREAIAATLGQWRGEARAAAGEMSSPLLQEAAPLPTSWAAIADLGLRAIDALAAHKPLVLTADEEGALATAQAPVADVTLAVAPSVKKLVDAAR
jgi:hexosaminidase